MPCSRKAVDNRHIQEQLRNLNIPDLEVKPSFFSPGDQDCATSSAKSNGAQIAPATLRTVGPRAMPSPAIPRRDEHLGGSRVPALLVDALERVGHNIASHLDPATNCT